MNVMEWKIPPRVFKSSTVYLQSIMFQFYLQNTVFHTNNISELLLYSYNVYTMAFQDFYYTYLQHFV